jgi:hypothetical protein
MGNGNIILALGRKAEEKYIVKTLIIRAIY